MLSLFRKKRKKLTNNHPAEATNNRLSTYIRYALGEIALVVIGILIALQINNWNEEREHKALLRTYILSIGEDIKADMKALRGSMKVLNEQVEAGKQIIPIMESKQKAIPDSLKFILAFNSFTGIATIPDRDTTWEFLNSSGLISDFPDTELLKLLQSYYLSYTQITDNYKVSGIPVRLELRQLKYELFTDIEHKKFFPTNAPKIPGPIVYDAIFSDKRVLPLCRYIGSTAIYFENRFTAVYDKGDKVAAYIDTHF